MTRNTRLIVIVAAVLAAVAAAPVQAQVFPATATEIFFDGFETGTGAWLTSAWAPSPDDPHSGLLSAASTDNGWISPRSSSAMVLADELDLSGASDPQLTFWLRGAVGDDGGGSGNRVGAERGNREAGSVDRQGVVRDARFDLADTHVTGGTPGRCRLHGGAELHGVRW